MNTRQAAWSSSRTRLLLSSAALVASGISGFLLVRLETSVVLGAVLVILMLILGFAASPVWLISLAFAAAFAASTYYGIGFLYYLRFLPLALLVLRGGAELAVRRLQLSRLDIAFWGPWGAYVLLAMASTLYSIDPAITLQRGLTLVLLFLAAVYVCNYANSRDTLEHIVVIIIPLALVALLLSGVAWAGGRPVWRLGNFQGIFINPNEFGNVLALAVPLLLWQCESAGPRLRRIYVLGLVLCVFFLILSISRTSILSVFMSTLVYFAVTTRRRQSVFRMIRFALVCLSAVILISMLGDQASMTFHAVSDISNDRVIGWKFAITLARDRPWLGYGFGTADVLFPQYAAELKALGFSGFGSPHNSYASAVLNTGVVGLTLILLTLAVVLVRGFQAIRDQPGDRFSASLLGTLVGLMVHAIAEGWLTSVGGVVAVPFWLCATVLVRYRQLQSAEV